VPGCARLPANNFSFVCFSIVVSGARNHKASLRRLRMHYLAASTSPYRVFLSPYAFLPLMLPSFLRWVFLFLAPAAPGNVEHVVVSPPVPDSSRLSVIAPSTNCIAASIENPELRKYYIIISSIDNMIRR
jgi:hypothetical protein